jgi:hypothetical protein
MLIVMVSHVQFSVLLIRQVYNRRREHPAINIVLACRDGVSLTRLQRPPSHGPTLTATVAPR